MKKNSSYGVVLGLVLIIQACSSRIEPVLQGTPTPVFADISMDITPTSDAESVTKHTPLGLPTSNEKKSLELNNVTVTAVDGNLFIRRGPHLAFNPIGVLYEGNTISAFGRDMLSRWLQVGLPSQAGSTGWISIQTRYSLVTGEIGSLPVMDTTDWPVGAFIRNCTHHEMLAQPGDYYLPSAYEFPDNEVSVFPGTYSVYDLEFSDKPILIETVELREGLEVEIREDAEGERRKCP